MYVLAEGGARGRGGNSATDGRRTSPVPDQSRQGPLPGIGNDEGRGHRLLHADRARHAPARRRPSRHPQTLAQRGGQRAVLREEPRGLRTGVVGASFTRALGSVGALSAPELGRGAGVGGAAGRTRTARAAVAVRRPAQGARHPDRLRPRSRSRCGPDRMRGGGTGRARPGREPRLDRVPGHQRQQGYSPVRAARPEAGRFGRVDRRETSGDGSREAAARTRHRHHGQGGARGKGVRRLEPEQSVQDHHRTVFVAGTLPAVCRGAAKLGRTRRPRPTAAAVRGSARTVGVGRRPARRTRPTDRGRRRPRRVPPQA